MNNPKNRPEKYIQIGEGVFLRGFFDYMLQKANDSGDYSANAVIVQPREHGRCSLLEAQNCLYTHIARGAEGVDVTDINSVSRCVDPYKDYDGFISLAHNPDFRFVVSNTTEAGIAYLGSDRFDMKPPLSFPAKMCRLLFERFTCKLPGFVFLPCELIENNGEELKKIILRYADDWGLDFGFKKWIEDENIFCNTLVDRIVTGYPNDLAEGKYADDKMLNSSEMFYLWVVEGDKRAREELPFERLGLNLIWTDNLSDYRTRKVRILNGAHTSLVPYAMLRGFKTVRECVENAEMSSYIRSCVYDEIIPTLDMPREDLVKYADDVMMRFSNPYIEHKLSSIALNCVDKFRVRVMPSIVEYKKRFGRYPEHLMKAFHALCEFYHTEMVNDTPEMVDFMRSHSEEEIWKWLANDNK